MSNFRQILLSWKDRHNGRFPDKHEARKEVFQELFQNYKDAGYEKSYFTTRVMGEINTETVNPGHYNKVKLRKWAKINAGLLETTLYRVFTEGDDIEPDPLLTEALPIDNIPDSIEDQIEEHNKKTTKYEPAPPKVQHFADSVRAPMDSVNEIDPEMALLMGYKIE